MLRRTSTATGYKPDSPDSLTCSTCKESADIPRLQTVRLTDPTLHQCGEGFTIPEWDPTPPGRQKPRRMEVVT